MDPATLSLLASLFGTAAPAVLSLFSEPQDPLADFKRLLAEMRKESSGARSATVSSARARGTAIGQNFEAAIGRSGLGPSGVGALGRGVAASYAGGEAARASEAFDNELVARAAELVSRGGFQTPNRLNAFLGGVAPMIAGGQNPFTEAAYAVGSYFTKSKKPQARAGLPDSRFEFFQPTSSKAVPSFDELGPYVPSKAGSTRRGLSRTYLGSYNYAG